ncbi:MAG: hypothetical protein Q8L05_09965 [Actinomycetota bacterium]|nr:hypothetical protein [Actinomycetota bacterium]MDP2289418.1 hypothetical protein [Actinomycetota bacterium]
MDDTELGEVRTIQQPWGKEEIFANVEGQFVGKVLHLRAGQRLALQMHTAAEEVVSLMSGAVLLEIGDDADSLRRTDMSPGQTIHIHPGTMLRLSAAVDSMLLEVPHSAPPQ